MKPLNDIRKKQLINYLKELSAEDRGFIFAYQVDEKGCGLNYDGTSAQIIHYALAILAENIEDDLSKSEDLGQKVAIKMRLLDAIVSFIHKNIATECALVLNIDEAITSAVIPPSLKESSKKDKLLLALSDGLTTNMSIEDTRKFLTSVRDNVLFHRYSREGDKDVK